ncbi:hypothetical protein [Solitalea koreensis]|nr:hypothetical protein [Solitalea koreensis]
MNQNYLETFSWKLTQSKEVTIILWIYNAWGLLQRGQFVATY